MAEVTWPSPEPFGCQGRTPKLRADLPASGLGNHPEVDSCATTADVRMRPERRRPATGPPLHRPHWHPATPAKYGSATIDPHHQSPEPRCASTCPDPSPSSCRAHAAGVSCRVRYDVHDAFPRCKATDLQERGHLSYTCDQPTVSRRDCGLGHGLRRRPKARFGSLRQGCRPVGGDHRQRRHPLPTVRDRHRQPTLGGHERLHQLGQTGRTITVSFGGFPPRQIAVGASTTFDQNFAGYLVPGVHIVHISLYGGDGADIWLR